MSKVREPVRRIRINRHCEIEEIGRVCGGVVQDNDDEPANALIVQDSRIRHRVDGPAVPGKESRKRGRSGQKIADLVADLYGRVNDLHDVNRSSSGVRVGWQTTAERTGARNALDVDAKGHGVGDIAKERVGARQSLHILRHSSFKVVIHRNVIRERSVRRQRHVAQSRPRLRLIRRKHLHGGILTRALRRCPREPAGNQQHEKHSGKNDGQTN